MAEEAVCNELQSSYKLVQQQYLTWKNAVQEAAGIVVSLHNMAEQYDCCERVVDDPLISSDFPHLKSRLLYKIACSMEEMTAKLYNTLNVLEKASGNVSVRAKKTMELYERRAADLCLEQLTQGQPTRPSIARMLEWLQDLDRLFHIELTIRKHSLQNVRFDQLHSVEELHHKWSNESTDLTNTTQEIFASVAYFLEKKV